MFYLPLFHNLEEARCLVIGGGQTAYRKLNWLVRTGAQVRVVARAACDEVREFADTGRIELELRDYREGDVDADLTLVIAATNDAQINRTIHAEATNARVLINCVDQPELCTVIFPAIVDRLPLLVAVSSMGASPTLARVARSWIEARLAPTLGNLGILAERVKGEVRATLPETGDRMAFWERLFAGRAGEQALAGELDAAVAEAIRALAEPDSRVGSVALVGAGPGDPELITLKALRLLQAADVILYDKLANPLILDYARRDAERIFVGKQGPKPGQPPTRPENRSNQQSSINDLLVHHALKGKNVVRLKGGDPFIYGRGGEEIEALMAAGVDCIVVPGITAALGAASYAGIPLTYRNLSQSVRFVTGHRIENAINLDWPELSRTDQTLVIYMGLVGLEQILGQMVEHGSPAERPAALVENATLPDQRVIVATVGTLVEKCRAIGVEGPSVAIVGEVVAKMPEPG